MEINAVQLDLNKNLNKVLHGSIDNDDKFKTNVSTPQSTVAENGNTKVTLSPKALTMLQIDKTQSNKTYEQKEKEYGIAKQKYQENVNDLPVDYRKMKAIKDRINEEIKMLKAEVSKIKQSRIFNEDEIKEQVGILEQQIAVKSLATIEIGKEFSQKLKEQERSKQISHESATDMLTTFNSSPPEAPVNN
jgi:hypothetical protein